MNPARETVISGLRSREFDLLVVGGGITGAGVARDAAMRGLSVALAEKGEFASGTSSRSSRLIHGGLRYLETAQIGLVKESSRERGILLRIAPALVRPLRFTWPVYEGARVPAWQLRLGLSVYDRLAQYSKMWQHNYVDAKAAREHEPALSRKGLAGAAVYFDAITDDRALTLANIESARAHGASAIDHAKVLRVTREAGVSVATVENATTTFEIRARCVVNATGPWRADLTRGSMDGSPSKQSARNSLSPFRPRRRREAVAVGTKGAHIVVPRDSVGNVDAITLLSAVDGRVMFVLPWEDRTIIGTTDTWTSENPDDVKATAADVDYLLSSVRPYFPDSLLISADVVDSWAGIRPLAGGSGAGNPGRISREHSVEESEPGMIVVTGGKLTTYRSMAVEIVDRAERSVRGTISASRTAEEMLAP